MTQSTSNDFWRWGEGIQLGGGGCPRWQSTHLMALSSMWHYHATFWLISGLSWAVKRELRGRKTSTADLYSEKSGDHLVSKHITNPHQCRLDVSSWGEVRVFRLGLKMFLENRDNPSLAEIRVNPGRQKCSMVFISFPLYRLLVYKAKHLVTSLFL